MDDERDFEPEGGEELADDLADELTDEPQGDEEHSGTKGIGEAQDDTGQ
jgi:hypothetical protein